MAIDEDLSFRLAFELTLIPECPRSDPAVESLSDMLREIFQDESEARAIVSEACARWDRWRGTRGLIELIEARKPALPPANQAVNLGPKPVIECAQCGDWGYFSRTDGTVEWCNCAAGRDTREQFPDLVDKLKRKGIEPPHEAPAVMRAPITQADIDRAFQERRDRTEEMITEQRAILDDPSSSADRKEIAREILDRFKV